jgi:hypothetical protein
MRSKPLELGEIAKINHRAACWHDFFFLNHEVFACVPTRHLGLRLQCYKCTQVLANGGGTSEGPKGGKENNWAIIYFGTANRGVIIKSKYEPLETQITSKAIEIVPGP